MASSSSLSEFSPEWKKLYDCAIVELDPVRLARLITEARRAILDRADEGLMELPVGECHAMSHALSTLRILEDVAAREKNAA
jgi:hypothetical protein